MRMQRECVEVRWHGEGIEIAPRRDGSGITMGLRVRRSELVVLSIFQLFLSSLWAVSGGERKKISDSHFWNLDRSVD